MDLASGSERVFLRGDIRMVLFEPSGTLLTGSNAGVQRWPVQADPQAPHRLRVGPPERIPVPVSTLNLIACSADGKVLAGSNFDGAHVWRRDRPHEAIPLKPHGDCRYVAVSPDGTLVATGAHNGSGLKVWDAQTGKLIREFLPETPFTRPCFSPDGRWLLSNLGHSWRVADWTEGPRHPPVGDVAFSPDSRLVARGGIKGFIPLVDSETGRELARLEDPHQNGLYYHMFSPDSTLLIGTTNDSFCVRVWDLRKIRAGLRDLGLDWDALPYPPAKTPVGDGLRPVPLEIELLGAVAMGGAADPAKKALVLNH
jgi:WD40 repeat protein